MCFIVKALDRRTPFRDDGTSGGYLYVLDANGTDIYINANLVKLVGCLVLVLEIQRAVVEDAEAALEFLAQLAFLSGFYNRFLEMLCGDDVNTVVNVQGG